MGQHVRYLKSSMQILSLVLLIHVPAMAGTGVKTLAEYFDLLASQNYESASYMWLEDVLSRANRHGIEYAGIPVKVDCNSPIVRNLRVMRHHLQPPAKNTVDLEPDRFYQYHYATVVDDQAIEHEYYSFHDGTYFWLIHPQDYYCRAWSVKESEYFRIHVQPQMEPHLNQLAMDAADRFVEDVCAELELDRADVQDLAEKKIEYYFCGSDEMVKLITGRRVKGMHHLPTDDIISAFFPHYHEMVRFLTAYRLRQLPLYAHPLIQEGLAVHFGGRWGKSPNTMTHLGVVFYRDTIVQLEPLLTSVGFEANAVSEIAYPVAGLFAAYLIDEIGIERVLQVYRDLAGDLKRVSAMSADTVSKVLLEATGIDSWQDLRADFEEFIDDEMPRNRVVLPGAIERGYTVVERPQITVKENRDWVSFEFTAHGSAAAGGTFLFGKEEALQQKASQMFQEQYADSRPFEGYRYAVRADSNEAGLYDYATNHLLAKYILSFAPSDEYIVGSDARIAVKFRRELFGKDLPSEGDCHFLKE